MNFAKNNHNGVWKALGYFALTLLLCRLTDGWIVLIITIIAAIAMTKNRPGLTLVCYMMMPMLIQINAFFRGDGVLLGHLCRICPVVLTFVVMIHSARRAGPQILPLGVLYAYSIMAIIPSMNGWCPPISYLKIINFIVFLLGLHLGTRNIDQYPSDLALMRNSLLAFSIFVIFGSLATIPFPSVGYSWFVKNMQMYTYIENADSFIHQYEGVKLFSGVANHSQTLSPIVIACAAWALLDMVFIEQRYSKLHTSLIVVSPILLYMSRSRMGFVGFVSALALVFFVAIPRAAISFKIKNRLRSFLITLAMFGVVFIAVGQMRSQLFSRWMRKTDDTSSDRRALTEAVTDSRQQLIEENLYYFSKKPLYGTGFQTSEAHKYAYQKGEISIFSAPIEKGLLPLMILGETGVIGAGIFVIFLFTFYGTCRRKRYLCSMTLMTVFLILNMAEASFFSPGGLGGALWIVLVVGGFTIDMINRNNQQGLNVILSQ